MTLPAIGGVKLRSRALLAPMAGLTDRAYRELCMRNGAGWCVSEMVSSKALSFKSKKSEELMEISGSERPCGIQIFGDDPQCMADAAKRAAENMPDFIDINMGCPAPKISGNGSGCALMKQPELCGEIVHAVTSVSPVPVTVKLRKGWDDQSVNAVEVAKICEQAGAAPRNRLISEGTTPIISDTREPYSIRVKTSLPPSSVPNICLAEGGDRRLRRSICFSV